MDLSLGQFMRPTAQSRQRVAEARSFQLPAPMLGKKGSESDLDRTGFSAERKYDGTRVMLVKRGNQVRLFTARGAHTEHTTRYPKLVADAKRLNCQSCILDGEFVWFDRRGNDVFITINARPETVRTKKFKYMAFDILEHNGQDTRSQPIEQRKQILDRAVPDNLTIIKETVVQRANKRRFFQEIVANDGEGVMLKSDNSRYSGGRTDLWKKVKKNSTIDCVVRGGTQGTGERSSFFGALHCYYPVNGRMQSIGDVGTGFDTNDLTTITEMLRQNNEFVIEVRFMEITPDKKMRHPAFLRLRPDKTPSAVARGESW